ncbi:MAG: hypothetical protein CL840_06015 [Crocinitomicaceae bacterium]|nr:hypothetical protein [Crocinitomicaceae bacterium]|tara:strand:+ start:2078 stop:4204 length:2127 start_codon:yes stop_codon:yes gene_type:complete
MPMQLFSLLLIFVFGLFSVAKAQLAPPELRCVSVEDNGDITLTWLPTADPKGQFLNYFIYTSVNGSNFTPPTSGKITNRLQNVKTFVGINFPGPTLKNYKFFIITEYFDGGIKNSIPSDTLTVIELDLSTTGIFSGTLNWNLMRTNPLPTWEGKYNLKRKLETVPPAAPPIAWTDKFATPDYSTITFKDNIARCLSDISYQIELKDASGCISKSNVAKARLEQKVGPAKMTFDQVSVNRFNGSTQLNWWGHPSNLVTSYGIFYVDPSGIKVPIDTVPASQLVYHDSDPNHDPTFSRQCYIVVAFDSCGKSQGGGQMHCTPYVVDSADDCAGEISLYWTPYVGWAEVESYDIYMRTSVDSNYRKIGSAPGRDTSFVVKKLNTQILYTFYIEARDKSGRFFGRSNLRGASFDRKGKPKFIKLRSASIVSDEEVELRVLLDRKKPFKRINMYRGINQDGPFKKVASLQPPTKNAKDTLFSLFDNSARPFQMGYYYYLEVIDLCDNAVRRSNNFRTIFLSGESNRYSMSNSLNWLTNVSSDSSAADKDVYSLYRGISKNYKSDPIRSLWSNEPSYLDDISGEVHNGDEFCYRLKLVQAPSDTFEIADTCLSNEICFKMEPDVFIPNSFTPNRDGINEVWRPKTSYINPFSNYSLKVFDRWGKLAFETMSPLEGWNGQRNNGDAPTGIYTYHLEVVTVYGSIIEYRGLFNLVR